MSVRNYADIGENAQIIMNALLYDQTLVKLLYFTDQDPLNHDDLTEEEILNKVYGKLIKIVPRVNNTEVSNSIVVIKFDSFIPNYQNSEFKDVDFKIEIITPLNDWIIKNVNLRPFLIMGRIESLLKGKTIKGLGKIVSEGANMNFLTDEVSDYEMSFNITSYD